MFLLNKYMIKYVQNVYIIKSTYFLRNSNYGHKQSLHDEIILNIILKLHVIFLPCKIV